MPENATLLELCNKNQVSALFISNTETSEYMVLAYFIDNEEGWINVYQQGIGIGCSHLFFWIVASKALDGEVLLPDNIVDIASAVLGEGWVIEE